MRGLTTVCGAGSAGKKEGFAIHVYTASISMDNSCLANADGDMLIVPQQGEAQIACCLTPICNLHPTQSCLKSGPHKRCCSSPSSSSTLDHTKCFMHHIYHHPCVQAASMYSNLRDTNTSHVANVGVSNYTFLTPRARKQSRIWWWLTSYACRHPQGDYRVWTAGCRPWRDLCYPAWHALLSGPSRHKCSKGLCAGGVLRPL